MSAIESLSGESYMEVITALIDAYGPACLSAVVASRKRLGTAGGPGRRAGEGGGGRHIGRNSLPSPAVAAITRCVHRPLGCSSSDVRVIVIVRRCWDGERRSGPARKVIIGMHRTQPTQHRSIAGQSHYNGGPNTHKQTQFFRTSRSLYFRLK